MGNTEIQATPAAEHFLADRVLDRVRVVLGPAFGEFDADLHRPAGMHRIELAEQGLPQGRHTDEIVEDGTQFLFRTHLAQALVVGLAIG
ncbi:hypothetical protein D3C85_847690 [compost metagenome]